MPTMAVTGHRPNKLRWGYNYNEPHWVKLKSFMKEKLLELNIQDAYSGMALGVDTVFALAVIELKNKGYNIRLHAAIPCANHCRQWPKPSQKLYYDILSNADEIVGMSENNFYEQLALYIYNNEYVLLKKDIIIDIDFNITPLSNNMIYSQAYKPYLMQKRNEYMVDNTETLMAVWNGTSGGTENCVKYAQKKNKDIIYVRPDEI